MMYNFRGEHYFKLSSKSMSSINLYSQDDMNFSLFNSEDLCFMEEYINEIPSLSNIQELVI